eukprot:GHVQ01041264.1.p1 GENE.GHVQ01041264.1~~GHVQ01041264.1.p1  ORF type:complete len:144 (+),score=7.22 GHVQ01041264.1:204-635(+)
MSSLPVCSSTTGGIPSWQDTIVPQVYQYPWNKALPAGTYGEDNCINYIKGHSFCSSPELANEEWKHAKYRNWAKEYLGISRQSKGFLGIATDPTIVGSVDEARNMLFNDKIHGLYTPTCFIERTKKSEGRGPRKKRSKTSGKK